MSYLELGFGKERPFQKKPLLLELVPSSSWGANLRSELPKKEWDRLRKSVYARSEGRCEVCGGSGSLHPVEAHERWSYDDGTRVQKLLGIEALCPRCHECRHLGRAINVGNGRRALAHLRKVNGWTKKEVDSHVEKAFETWERRSRESWTLDLTWLNDAEI